MQWREPRRGFGPPDRWPPSMPRLWWKINGLRRGRVARAGHAGALPRTAIYCRRAQVAGSRARARGGQIGGIGLQKVAIDTLQLLCVVGVIETLGTVSWRMAPTSGTRKISGASGSDQESLVEALLEGMGEGFFAFDHSWRLTASNSAAEAILGAPSAEVVGELLWNVLPQIRGTEFERRCRLVIEKRTREEFEIYSALRPHRHHEVRAFPFGADVGVAFRDITGSRAEIRRRSVTGNWSSFGFSA